MRKGHKVSFVLAVISIVCLLIYTAEILHYGVVIWWMLPIGAMCGVMAAVINYRIYKNSIPRKSEGGPRY